VFVISLIVALLAGLGWILKFSGFMGTIPVLNTISMQIWGGVFIVAALVAMFTRRPSN